MDKKVEYLKKENINSYLKFIKNVFDFDGKEENIEKLIEKNIVLVVKDKDEVIASVVLEEHFEYIKGEKYYHIEYFGVLEQYRNMGYANMLFDKIEELVRENAIKYLELTSGNHRKAAHNLYKNRGFEVRDTSVFVKKY